MKKGNLCECAWLLNRYVRKEYKGFKLFLKCCYLWVNNCWKYEADLLYNKHLKLDVNPLFFNIVSSLVSPKAFVNNHYCSVCKISEIRLQMSCPSKNIGFRIVGNIQKQHTSHLRFC